MFRKLFCYTCFFAELMSIGYIIFDSIGIVDSLLISTISLVFLSLNLYILLIAIILFGAPNNYYKEYDIKYISYRDIFKNDFKLIVTYNNGIWEFFYKGNQYKLNLKGWPNIKKRVMDILYIQFHNNYCNINFVPDKDYVKDFFKKGNMKITFIKKDKVYIKKFKPSFILKLKMLITVSQIHSKRDSNSICKRHIEQTFFILGPLQKKKK